MRPRMLASERDSSILTESFLYTFCLFLETIAIRFNVPLLGVNHISSYQSYAATELQKLHLCEFHIPMTFLYTCPLQPVLQL